MKVSKMASEFRCNNDLVDPFAKIVDIVHFQAICLGKRQGRLFKGH
jgi:hypothetical protein